MLQGSTTEGVLVRGGFRCVREMCKTETVYIREEDNYLSVAKYVTVVASV